MRKVVILGSTGSIGVQTLEVIRKNPREFQVMGLSANKNLRLLEEQAREFGVKHVVSASVSENPQKALEDLVRLPSVDLVVNAVSGRRGLAPTIAAVKAGKAIALANKESMVMAGEMIMGTARKTGAEIIPVDSELSAVWQILGAGRGAMFALGAAAAAKRIILTASGGPFWGLGKSKLKNVTAAQALRHPMWKMGQKITIDSATLMNKGFEIMEARWLFDIAPGKIDAVIHRQSVVHALVEFADGSMQAVLSAPDMKVPIANALFYPRSIAEAQGKSLPRLELNKLNLAFEKPDFSLFEGPKIAKEVLAEGGIMPAALCIADEIAVEKFLIGQIAFLEIYDFIKRSLALVKNRAFSMEAVSDLISSYEHRTSAGRGQKRAF